MIKVKSGNDIFEELLGEIDYDVAADTTFPFKVRCAIIKYRSPAHPYFEYVIDMGRPLIGKILYEGDTFKPPEHICLVFPERWMSVHEQYSLMNDITKLKNVDRLKQVDIVTSSPIIVGNFRRQMIRIITFEDDKYFKNSGNL